MLTLGDYSQLNGGWFGTDESGNAVTCVHQQGYRSQVDGVYFANQAANSVALQMGTTAAGSTTPVANDVRIASNQSPASGSIGIDVQSPDAELTNVWVAQNAIGIKGTTAGAARMANVHVWSNTTGISGSSWDKSQWQNVYVESNLGWGVDIDKMDHAYWSGVYVWNNGAGVGSTGGMRFQQTSGSAHKSVLEGVFLDDNTGTGLLVNGPDDYEIQAILSSSSVQGGGSVITTTGVSITSASFGTVYDILGSDATTPILDLGGSTDRRAWLAKTAPSGTVLGLTDTQSPTNKTFNNTNIFTVRDDRFTMQDDVDATKQLTRDLSTIPTGVTRKMMAPVSRTSQFSLANSTTQTDIVTMTLGSGVLVVGSTFRIIVKGTIQVVATSGILTFRPYIGANAAAQTFVMPTQGSAAGPVQFWLEADVTVRSTGAGGLYVGGGSGLVIIGGWYPLASTSSSGVTVDTTVSSPVVKLTAQWATADVANILKIETATIEQVV